MTFSVFIRKATAFLLAIFITIVPYTGFSKPGLQAKKDDCKMNISLISDVHIEAKGIFRTTFLKKGLKAMAKAKTPVDAVVIAGDLTNYADEPSVAKYYDIIKKYSPAPVVSVSGNHDIGHAGDRDVTDITREQARDNMIKYYNDYSGRELDTIYYSTEINGYKFIVLGDEVIDGGHWDMISMSEEQLSFLDSELASAPEGQPVFVCCHWPIKGINGEPTIWEDSGIDPEEYNVPAILEKYDNVFYISGHMHGGIRSEYVGEKFDIPMAEQVNGVTYLSLPTFGIVNMFGIPVSGTGAQLEVYDDEVIFRPVNYLTGRWYTNSAYTFELLK